MSHSQVAPPHSGSEATGRAVKRPGTLTALTAVSVLSALAAFLGAVLVFVGGKGLADQNIKDVIHDHPDVVGLPSGTTAADIKAMSGPLWEEMISERQGSLVARAVMALVLGVCLLIFGLCARKGATWARVLITISAVLALLPHFLIFGDYEPASVTAASVIALLTAVVAIVFCWLPANGRYAKQLKA